MSLVTADNLIKRFDDFTAVDGVDFSVDPGEVFGFLGPNGAGKPSIMRMIACVSEPSGGSLRVLGKDPVRDGPEIRGRIGVVAQEDNLDTELSVWDNILVYGRYFGLPRREIAERAEELLEFANLVERRDDQVDPLSGGMKRRLTIARSLVNSPEMVLLDEPTTGLDPQARQNLWDGLYGLKRRGITLILTTHYMDEAEQLCDRLVVMDEGRIAAEGSPRSLIETHVTAEVVELRFDDDDRLRRAVKAAPEVSEGFEVVADRILLYTDHGDKTRQALADRGVEPTTALTRRSTLEDVFLTLTGRSLHE